ncbi:MAG TPA: methyltransferase domain-containing protein [Candidatus Paceibacterota bacterium]
MGRIEHDEFEKASKENYKRWVIPLVDDVFGRIKKINLKILDVACGPGFLTKELAKRSSRFTVFGLDNYKYTLKLARKNCRGLKGIIFKLASVYRMPFPDGYFDLVVCKDSLHHFDNLKLALKEMFRVVKPSGLVYVQDLRRDIPSYLLKMAIPPDTTFKKLQYYSARASYTKKELGTILKELGIKNYIIKTRNISDKLERQYQKIGISPQQLKAAFQSRFIAMFHK